MKSSAGLSIARDQGQVIRTLIDGPLPLACWKLPNEQKTHLIVGGKLADTTAPLRRQRPGFVINAYKANHPVKAQFIPADLYLLQDEHWHLAPEASDQIVDRVKHLLKTSVAKPTKRRPIESVSITTYEEQVARAISSLQSGELAKVVLARYEDLPLHDFDPWTFFQQLLHAYPDAFCSLTYLPGRGLWIGATPELLLEDTPAHFKTVALAGTKGLNLDARLSELSWTQKEIEEQAMVSRYVINCFKALRLREFHEIGPKTVRAGALAHLKTTFIVYQDEVHFSDLAEQMLVLLHPTSAVCGMPRITAQQLITELEHFDRAYFAGFLGPVGFGFQSHLYVNLRCMHIQNQVARLYAGAGITSDSTPQKEAYETQMKISILRRWLKPYVASGNI